MVDVHAVVLTYLLSVTALTDLAGTRIWPGVDLEEGYDPGDGPAILFNRRGGPVAYHNATLEASMQYQCYAATMPEADEVDRALADALNDKAAIGIRQSRLEVQGQPLRDPDTGWPYVLSFYRHWIVNS